MKITWLTYGVSPYKMALAQELSKYIKLEMFLYNQKDVHRDKSFYDLGNYDFSLNIISNNWKKQITHSIKDSDFFIDSMYSTKYGIYATNVAKKNNVKSILQADGGIAKDRGLLINGAMSKLMDKHDYFLSSSEYVDKYFNYYSKAKKQILRYRFSSLAEKDIIDNKILSDKKEELKKKFGFSDRFTIVSVGQIIPRKGYDILLDVLSINRLCDQVDTYIIGGQPTGQLNEIIKNKNIANVNFLGSMPYEDIKKYYAASDAFVLCTREDIWGLVINEALSFGLPTITSDNCVAGLHFKNAVKICGVNDTKAYYDAIISLMNDKNLCDKIKDNSFKEIASYTIENSAKDIYENLLNISKNSSSMN